MTLHEYPDLEQGSDAWLEQRRGMVTASVVDQLITTRKVGAIDYDCPACGALKANPCRSKVKRAGKVDAEIKTMHSERVALSVTNRATVIEPASNDYSRALTATLVAERITGWSDPVYVNNDMLRGIDDEPRARDLYGQKYAHVVESGFMVRELDNGYRLGFSPDGLVGVDGLIEVKSRRPKKHLQTILANEVPLENVAQCQAGLLVSGREWLDYISYCGGMPMFVKRVLPEPRWFDAITQAVRIFEESAAVMVALYEDSIQGLPTTERPALPLEMVI